MQDKGELVKRSEAEAFRHRDLSSLLCKADGNRAETENDLARRMREQEDLRAINAGLSSANFEARNEVEALKEHCNVLSN